MEERLASGEGLVLTVSEVADLLGLSRSTVYRRGYPTCPVASERGREVMGIPLSALPTAAQQRFLGTRGTGQDVAADDVGGVPAPAGPPDLPGVPVTPDGVPDVAALEAAGRAGQVREWERRSRAVSMVQERLSRADHGERGAVWREVADAFRVAKRTLRRWVKNREEGGPLALFPRSGRDPGARRFPEALVQRAVAFYLDQRRPTYADVMRFAVVPWCRERGLAAPHPDTVARWIEEETKPFERVAFRHGLDAFRERCSPKVFRPVEKLEPNEAWAADHRLMDVFVVVPDGKGSGWGRHGKAGCPCGSGRERRDCCSLRRPWLTAIEDVASGAFVGYRLGMTPTAAGVCHALRDGLLQYGIPERFVRDCGREFAANRLGGKPARLRGPEEVGEDSIFEALGIELTTTIPYHAWSKPIESAFRGLSAFCERFIPGWCGRDAADKPDILGKHIERGLLLTWAQFGLVFDHVIHLWNATHEVGDRPKPPNKFYHGFKARMPDPRTVAYLIQDEVERKVTTQGVKLGGTWFWCEALAPYVGMKLRVRWDEESAARVTIGKGDDARREPFAYVYGDNEVLIVAANALEAEWGSWGEPNKRAKRGERLQRAQLALTRDKLRDAVDIETADPFGAFRLVADRVLQQKVEAGEAEPPPEAGEPAHIRALGAVRERVEAAQRAEDEHEADDEDEPDGMDRVAAAVLAADLGRRGFGAVGGGGWSLEDLVVGLADALGVRVGAAGAGKREQRAARLWGLVCLATKAGQRHLRRADPRVGEFIEWAGLARDERPLLGNLAGWLASLRAGRDEPPPRGQRVAEGAVIRLDSLARDTWAGDVEPAAALSEVRDIESVLRSAGEDLADAPDDVMKVLDELGFLGRRARKGAAA